MTLDLGMDWRRSKEEGGMLSEREGMMCTDDRVSSAEWQPWAIQQKSLPVSSTANDPG